VQDTYVTALEKADEFKALASLKTYLYRIVINKSIDARRRKVRWQGLLDTKKVELAQSLQSDAESADTSALEYVRTAVNKIPEIFRIPFLLSEIDGVSYEEIADIMRLSLNTVRTRIFRCREKLRKELTKPGLLS
jgi:RNA polymerase sigma-70 factor (ECF subfamily)